MHLSESLYGYEISCLVDGYSPLTLAAYKSALGKLIDYLVDPVVNDITENDLKRFFSHLRTTYKPEHSDSGELSTASLHRYWKAIRSYFKWASLELHTGRPDLNFKMPRHSNKEIIPYTENEVQRMLAACQFSRPIRKADKKAYRFRCIMQDRNSALILLMLDTGIRPGELTRLKVMDLDLENGDVQIRPHHIGKTKPRVVIICAKTRRAIWKYLSTRGELKPHDTAFITEQGEDMSRYSLGSLISAIGDKASVPGANPYRFRHTFAIQYLRNGGDIYTLQRLLGHSNLETGRRYLLLSQTDAAEAHRRASPVDRWNIK